MLFSQMHYLLLAFMHLFLLSRISRRCNGSTKAMKTEEYLSVSFSQPPRIPVYLLRVFYEYTRLHVYDLSMARK